VPSAVITIEEQAADWIAAGLWTVSALTLATLAVWSLGKAL
jgi:hypothetical protein